jgi:hypothetical protein
VPVTRQDAFEAPPLRPLRYLSVSEPSESDLSVYRTGGECLGRRTCALCLRSEICEKAWLALDLPALASETPHIGVSGSIKRLSGCGIACCRLLSRSQHDQSAPMMLRTTAAISHSARAVGTWMAMTAMTEACAKLDHAAKAICDAQSGCVLPTASKPRPPHRDSASCPRRPFR